MSTLQNSLRIGTITVPIEDVRWAVRGGIEITVTTAIYRDLLEDSLSGRTSPVPIVVAGQFMPCCTIDIDRRDLTTTLHVRAS